MGKKVKIFKENLRLTKINKSKIKCDNDLLSEQRSERKGKEKMLLLHKEQYRTLFPDKEKVY